MNQRSLTLFLLFFTALGLVWFPALAQNPCSVGGTVRLDVSPPAGGNCPVYWAALSGQRGSYIEWQISTVDYEYWELLERHTTVGVNATSVNLTPLMERFPQFRVRARVKYDSCESAYSNTLPVSVQNAAYPFPDYSWSPQRQTAQCGVPLQAITPVNGQGMPSVLKWEAAEYETRTLEEGWQPTTYENQSVLDQLRIVHAEFPQTVSLRPWLRSCVGLREIPDTVTIDVEARSVAGQVNASAGSACSGDEIRFTCANPGGRIIGWGANILSSPENPLEYTLISPKARSTCSHFLKPTPSFALKFSWSREMYTTHFWKEYQERHGSRPKLAVFAIIEVEGCGLVATEAVEIPLAEPSVGGVTASNHVICQGHSPAVPLQVYDYLGKVQRWERSATGNGDWTAIDHGDRAYLPPPEDRTWHYRAIVRGACGADQASIPAEVRAVDRTKGGLIAVDPNHAPVICQGEYAPFLMLEGHQGNVLGWQRSTDGGSTWADIVHLAPLFDPGRPTRPVVYRATIQASGCPMEYSKPYKVDVLPELAPNPFQIDPGWRQSYCLDETILLSVAPDAARNIKWEYAFRDGYNGCSQAWSHFGKGANLERELGQTGNFCIRAVFYNDIRCQPWYTQPIQISVRDCEAMCKLNCGSTKVCPGTSVRIEISGSEGEVLRWEAKRESVGLWEKLPSTGRSIIYRVEEETCFRVLMRMYDAYEFHTEELCIQVYPPPKPGRISTRFLKICRNEIPTDLKIQEHDGDILRWESSFDGITWTSLPNSRKAIEYRPEGIKQPTYFRAAVGICDSVTYPAPVFIDVFDMDASDPGEVTVLDEVLCPGGSVKLKANPILGQLVGWIVGRGTRIDTLRSTDNPLTLNDIQPGTSVAALVQNNACRPMRSEYKNLVLRDQHPNWTVGYHGYWPRICDGKSITLKIRDYNGKSSFWEYFSDSTEGWKRVPSSENVNELKTDPIYRPTKFRKFSVNGCYEAYSKIITVSLSSSLKFGTIVGPVKACSNEAPLIYEYRYDHSAGQAEWRGDNMQWKYSYDGATWKEGDLYSSYLSFDDVPDSIFHSPGAKLFIKACIVEDSCETCSQPFVTEFSPVRQVGSIAGPNLLCSPKEPFFLTYTGEDQVTNWELGIGNCASRNTYYRPLGVSGATLEAIAPDRNVNLCYRAVLDKDGCGKVRRSEPHAVQSASSMSLGRLESDATQICAGETPAPVRLTGSFGTIMRWESSTDGENWLTIPEVRSATYQPPLLDGNRHFRAWVDLGSCGQLPTRSIEYKHLHFQTGTLSPADTVLCGTERSVKVRSEGHFPQIAYWERSSDGQNWIQLRGNQPQIDLELTPGVIWIRQTVACRLNLRASAPVRLERRVAASAAPQIAQSAICPRTREATLLMPDSLTHPVTRWFAGPSQQTASETSTATGGSDEVILPEGARWIWAEVNDPACGLLMTPAIEPVFDLSVCTDCLPIENLTESDIRWGDEPMPASLCLPAEHKPIYVKNMPETAQIRITGRGVSGDQTRGFDWQPPATGGTSNVLNIELTLPNTVCRKTLSASVLLSQPKLEEEKRQIATCSVCPDGSIEVNVYGGFAPYEHRLGDGTWQPAPKFSELRSGRYRLETRDAAGCSNELDFELEHDKLCKTPQDLRIERVGQREAFIVWNPENGIKRYHFDVKPNTPAVRNWMRYTLSDGSASAYLITNLQPGREYLLRVQRRCFDSESEFTDTLVFNTLDWRAGAEYAESAAMRIYPNPTRGPLTVELPEAADWQLFDLTGRLLESGASEAAPLALDLSDRPSGVYLLRLRVDGLYREARVVKIGD